MGLEAYLIKIYFKKPITVIELTKDLNDLGFIVVDKEISWISYEFETNKGILEAQVFEKNNSINILSLRFAIFNPNSVVEMVFNVLKALNNKYEIRIDDYELNKIVDISTYEKEMQYKLKEKRKKFPSGKNIFTKPIRAGRDVFEYVNDSEKKK